MGKKKFIAFIKKQKEENKRREKAKEKGSTK